MQCPCIWYAFYYSIVNYERVDIFVSITNEWTYTFLESPRHTDSNDKHSAVARMNTDYQ